MHELDRALVAQPASKPMGSAAEWGAIDALFKEATDLHESRPVPKPSYGCDAPVTVKGPTPGSIGPPKKATAPAKKYPKATAPKRDPKEIWDAAEVADAGDVDDIDDGRAQPMYDIVFKQRVSPEDMFLGIDPVRHEGTACADDIVLKVELPGTKLADIDLDVRPTFVRLQAPKYKLKAYLPETVNEQRGNAKWDADKELLTVTLPVVPQLDGKLQTSISDELD